MFLYEEIDKYNEYVGLEPLPQYIKDGLSKRIELREYQINAFKNFITYYNSDKLRKNKQLHLLFHMATGSGKTLMMAGLILYLYKQGYRNFLFFVNLTNIVEKTKENFLNQQSSKHLFAENIVIDGDNINVKEVSNFQNVNNQDINICFTTTQKLHLDLLAPKENSLTIPDFEDKKIVLISDESHHVNTITKKAKANIEEEQSWEFSVNQVFMANRDNAMIEFTATCDLKDPNVLGKYEDKIIFNYPLAKFRESKFTKDFKNMQSDYDLWDRTLIALVLSQYRLKLFADIKQPTKPVVLLKSQKIAESEAFYELFFEKLSSLSGYEIAKFNNGSNGAMTKCFEYMNKNGVSNEMLAEEVKMSFSKEHSIIINGSTDNSAAKQLAVNTLEDNRNPYRIIFTVDMLNEGWDVLNLFDIVRLYETRQSSGKKISPYTIKEAQLIGRGARYSPFRENETQEKYKRKYDDDVTNEMRICETMYYHSKDDSRYINELRDALKEIGLLPQSKVEVEYILKDSFKSEELYKSGFVFANKKIEKNRNEVNEINGKIRSFVANISTATGSAMIYDLFGDGKSGNAVKTHRYSVKVKTVEHSIAFSAISNFDGLKFNVLKSHFPNLSSTREFLTNDKYLGNILMNITTTNNPIKGRDLYFACMDVFKTVSDYIGGIEKEYGGTKEFFTKRLREIVKNKTRYIENPHGDGEGISQKEVSGTDANKMKLDLSLQDWYVYNDNYGTTEEKKFVYYFAHIVDELKKKYNKVYLVRNERFPELAIYNFDTGERFEPDYLLILQKLNTDGFEQQQIFVEPKGTGFIPGDQWKEDFMRRIENEAIAKKTYADDNDYKIIGLPFYNSTENNDIFVSAIEKLYK